MYTTACYNTQDTAQESYRMSFPDMVVVLQMNVSNLFFIIYFFIKIPTFFRNLFKYTLFKVFQLKLFVKECKNVNYIRNLETFSEKIEENSELISNERHGVSLTDAKEIVAWESNTNQLKSLFSEMLLFVGKNSGAKNGA